MSKRCQSCHYANEDDRIFCAHCGEPLDADLKLAIDLKRYNDKKASQPTEQRRSRYDDDSDDSYVPRKVAPPPRKRAPPLGSSSPSWQWPSSSGLY